MLTYILLVTIQKTLNILCTWKISWTSTNWPKYLLLIDSQVHHISKTAFDLTAHMKSKLLSAIRSCRMKTAAKAISHLQKRWSVTAARTPHCSSRQPRLYSPPSSVQLRDVVATWPFLAFPCVILAMFYLPCSETAVSQATLHPPNK